MGGAVRGVWSGDEGKCIIRGRREVQLDGEVRKER